MRCHERRHTSAGDAARCGAGCRRFAHDGVQRLLPARPALGATESACPRHRAHAWLRRPDPAARSLRTGRHGALGLVFSEDLPFAFSDRTATLLLQGVAEACREQHANLLLIATRTAGEASPRWEAYRRLYVMRPSTVSSSIRWLATVR